MTKNIGESVRSRLKNIAVKEGSDFNAVLTRYGLERLLYRIGESEYSKQFLLKGPYYLTYGMTCLIAQLTILIYWGLVIMI